MRPLFRPPMKLGPEHYKTYQVSAPLASHHRKATCKEVECKAWREGFVSKLDVSTSLGQRQARYIEQKSGRRFLSTRSGTIITYRFPFGQECFRSHTVPLEREPFFIVKGGDFRGNPRGIPAVQRSMADWIDDFANHQAGVAEVRARG